MVKSIDMERKLGPQHIKAPWLLLCSLSLISLIIGSLIGIQVLVPFSIGRPPIHSSSYSDLESFSHTRFKEAKKSSTEDAEDLLIDSLVLFKELLVKISKDESTTAISQKNTKKHVARDVASDFMNFFSGGVGGGGLGSPNPGAGANAGGGLAAGFTRLAEKLGFGNIAEKLSAGAADASKYLGIGIGNGTITGLDLPPQFIKVSKVMKEKPSGINLIAANLGQGLSSSLIGSVNLSSFTSDTSTFGPTAKAIGEGVGNGAAAGFKLKAVNATVPSNKTGIPVIAENLVEGLTSSFLSNVDLKSVLSMGNLSNEQINSAANSLAQGLGGGAAFATKLSTKPPSNSSFGSSIISGAAGNLGQGLSMSFLQDINFKELVVNNVPAMSPGQIADAAKGLGAGLAGGAVVGVGLQPEGSGSSIKLMPGGLGEITQSFGKGLTQSFLVNGTVVKLLASMKPAGQLDIGSVAKGLAIGLVDGTTTGFDNAGGVKHIFNLDPSSPPQVINSTKPSTFNDTVGGAATGFGSGLALQATTFALELFGKPPLNQAASNPSMMALVGPSSGLPMSGTAANGQPSNGTPANGQSPNGATAVGLRRRQTTTIVPANTSGQQTVNPSDLLDLQEFNGTITPIVQTAVDTLKCQGIGGLASVLFSIKSKAVSTSSVDVNDLKDKVSRLGFAKQTINIVSKESGDTYDINISEFQVKVNGNGLKKTIVILVLHILLAIVLFGNVIPIIFIIGSTRNIAVMSGRSDVLKYSTRIRWILAIVVVLPVTLIVFITGILAEGTKSHFRSSHGIVGLVLSLLILPAFPLAYFAGKGKMKLVFFVVVGLVLQLCLIAMVTGFLDLSSLVFCATQIVPQPIFMIIGILLAAPILLATTFLSLEILLKRWRGDSKNGDRRSNFFLSGRSGFAPEEGLGEKRLLSIVMNRSGGEKNFI